MFKSSVKVAEGIIPIKLDGVVLADKVENRLAEHYGAKFRRASADRRIEFHSICLDFRRAVYVDVAALVNCIALMADRKKRQLNTWIKYPRKKEVRDFFTVWRFPEAVALATGEAFQEFLDYDDRHYLQETQTTYTGRGGLLDGLEFDADWQQCSVSKRNFFEFTSFSSETGEAITPRGMFVASPRLESTRWAGELVKAVLEKHLPGASHSDEVARVVVYEAMSNAVRHPEARIIQTVSRFFPKMSARNVPTTGTASNIAKDIGKVAGTLRLCVWDDGEGIAETLRKPLVLGKSVRSISLPSFMLDRIRISLRDFEENELEERFFDQDTDPTASSPEHELLLSSLSPGITRTASEAVPDVEPYKPTEGQAGRMPILRSAPGMGLYALLRTAVDQLKGTLFIRSGRCRLLLELAPRTDPSVPGVRYTCKVTNYPSYYPQFHGNLLVVQLRTRG